VRRYRHFTRGNPKLLLVPVLQLLQRVSLRIQRRKWWYHGHVQVSLLLGKPIRWRDFDCPRFVCQAICYLTLHQGTRKVGRCHQQGPHQTCVRPFLPSPLVSFRRFPRLLLFLFCPYLFSDVYVSVPVIATYAHSFSTYCVLAIASSLFLFPTPVFLTYRPCVHHGCSFIFSS
jgi:hypothetical protein